MVCRPSWRVQFKPHGICVDFKALKKNSLMSVNVCVIFFIRFVSIKFLKSILISSPY